jgi:hypothetical protein
MKVCCLIAAVFLSRGQKNNLELKLSVLASKKKDLLRDIFLLLQLLEEKNEITSFFIYFAAL